MRTIQTLFFAGNRDEHYGRVKFEFAEDASRFHRYSSPTGVVIGSRRKVTGVHYVGFTRVIVAGYKVHAFRSNGVGSFQHGHYVTQRGRLNDAWAAVIESRLGLFDRLIERDFKTPTTVFAIALELRLNPVGGRQNTCSGLQIGLGRRDGRAIMKLN